MRNSSILFNDSKFLPMDRLVKPIVNATKIAKYEPFYFQYNPNVNTDNDTNVKNNNNSKLSINESTNKDINDDYKFDTSSIDRWYKYIVAGEVPDSRFSHLSFVFEDELYVLLGYNYKHNLMNKEIFKVRIKENYNNWERISDSKGDFPEIESGAAGALIDDKFYVFGGYISSLKCNSLMYEYNIKTNIWTIVSKIEESPDSKNIKVPYNNLVNNVSKHNPSIKDNMNLFYTSSLYVQAYQKPTDKTVIRRQQINSLIELNPDLQIANHIMLYSKSLNGLIIHGGLNNNKRFNKRTFLFDLESKTFKTIIDFNESDNPKFKAENHYTVDIKEENYMYNHSGFISEDNQLYIIGGVNLNHKHTNSMYKLDLNKYYKDKEHNDCKWEKINILNSECLDNRAGHSITYYNDHVYIFGGKNKTGQEMNSVCILDMKNFECKQLHPTLLEIDSESSNHNNLDLSKNNVSHISQQGSLLFNKHSSNFLSSFKTNSTIKKKKEKKISREDQEKHKFFDSLLNNSPTYSSAKYSYIANLEHSETNKLKTSVRILFNKSKTIKESSFGIIPAPRDQHSCVYYDKKLIIFGGDRNKFSYNDLFAFLLETSVPTSI